MSTFFFNEISSRSQRRIVAKISAQQQHDPNRILIVCRHAARHSLEKLICLEL